MSEQQHIAIIGGGIIGVTSAYYLASSRSQSSQPPPRITIIEGSSIAAGASGKAGGLLAVDWHGSSTSSLAKLSYRLHRELAQEYDGQLRWGYRKLDTLSISADLSHGSHRSKHSKTTRSDRLADQFPWLDQEVLTSSNVLGSQETTSQVHPELFTKAIHEEAERLGVETIYGTVDGLSSSSSNSDRRRHVLSITLRDESFSSSATTALEVDQIIIAAGPWTGRLLEELNKGGSISRQSAGRALRIDGSRAHSVVLKPAEGRELPAQALFTSIKEKKGGEAEPEIYNRPDGTAYACGATDSSALPSHASKVTTSPSAIETLLNHTSLLSPSHLSKDQGAQVVKEQACYLPVGSGDPVIGEVGDGIWVASGHSCWGICNGPGTGKVIAELVLEGKAKSANISSLSP